MFISILNNLFKEQRDMLFHEEIILILYIKNQNNPVTKSNDFKKILKFKYIYNIRICINLNKNYSFLSLVLSPSFFLQKTV